MKWLESASSGHSVGFHPFDIPNVSDLNQTVSWLLKLSPTLNKGFLVNAWKETDL